MHILESHGKLAVKTGGKSLPMMFQEKLYCNMRRIFTNKHRNHHSLITTMDEMGWVKGTGLKRETRTIVNPGSIERLHPGKVCEIFS